MLSIPASPVNMLYMLDEEINQEFGYCILFNDKGNFYPCNDKGRKEEVKLLLFEVYKELYRLKLVK